MLVEVLRIMVNLRIKIASVNENPNTTVGIEKKGNESISRKESRDIRKSGKKLILNQFSFSLLAILHSLQSKLSKCIIALMLQLTARTSNYRLCCGFSKVEL